ncbi:protein FAR1-RELATED SEQUENCE 5-like [Cornus florida]|uniref:protein FAR1-RELATED SEQUENCE 5-like n=1 Tax=Cornus florida TaxID=4283 RepID=UPI002896AEB9|nr:protein FAR1-RELATED SEQUENCE 5-like [Cornus florida]XP_059651126.1 protein FAR1-RELATED SEQUENCE 5-like [Cornus florida]XP_059651129.1 protein FAR1-RELATED SEQUENCE 5-like [Cornus florida]XP_059651136.1 protein FAR1-RELATED SEQUENCE 5-like [Cornus florida]
MAGTSAGPDFFDADHGSDEETSENLELEAREDGLFHNCNSHTVLNDGLVFLEPSANSLKVENLEPFSGMTFPSLDDARDFYYGYAKRTGFTIRTNRIRHSLKNMGIIGRDFVCSREGFRAAKHTIREDRVLPPRPITREGCKAMIRLAARDGGKWEVTKFVREHNHKLMTNCKFPGELPIVNILSEEEKDKKIQDLFDELQHERERSAALRRQVCVILKDIQEHAEFMSIRVEDIVNSMKEIEFNDV